MRWDSPDGIGTALGHWRRVHDSLSGGRFHSLISSPEPLLMVGNNGFSLEVCGILKQILVVYLPSSGTNIICSDDRCLSDKSEIHNRFFLISAKIPSPFADYNDLLLILPM